MEIALSIRVQDFIPSVLEALYSQPAQLLPVVLAQAETYIRSLSSALHEAGSTLGRNAVKAHMTFVIAHLYPALVQGGKVDLAFRVVTRYHSTPMDSNITAATPIGNKIIAEVWKFKFFK